MEPELMAVYVEDMLFATIHMPDSQIIISIKITDPDRNVPAAVLDPSQPLYIRLCGLKPHLNYEISPMAVYLLDGLIRTLTFRMN